MVMEHHKINVLDIEHWSSEIIASAINCSATTSAPWLSVLKGRAIMLKFVLSTIISENHIKIIQIKYLLSLRTFEYSEKMKK